MERRRVYDLVSMFLPPISALQGPPTSAEPGAAHINKRSSP